MAKIGDVEFNVIDEERSFDSEVTEHPVEDGADIADHIQIKPRSFKVNGKVTGPEAGPKHLALHQLQSSKEPVNYKGRGRLNNCVVESLTTSVDVDVKNGFDFSMTIREIEVAKPSTIGLLPADLKADTSEIGNAGRVQTQ